MSYTRPAMLYDNGTYYKWSAEEDHDNPDYTSGTDHSELNRTEGYEVLHFINYLGEKYWALRTKPVVYEKIERLIRYAVPADMRIRKEIEDWIVANWSVR